MDLRLAVKPYRRRFGQPLKTAHGCWQMRTGLIVRLSDESGDVSYGEIAPIPWFGSESLVEAEDWCRQWQGKVVTGDELAVPDTLPATRFGIESALTDLHSQLTDDHLATITLKPQQVCGLLPAGYQALSSWQGDAPKRNTWKWKIGVFSITEELGWLENLAETLPESACLRLDANGGLTCAEAKQWLAKCDRINRTPQTCTIEFLEQPLPPADLDTMQRFSQQFETAIALDESVATLAQLKACGASGWSGWMVVKPAIAGAPREVSDWLRQVPHRLVFSSCLETGVGRQAALRLAINHYQHTLPRATFPALGFGTLHYFDDDWDGLTPEQLWQRL
jgi:O-succinylbenzoate synthase